MASQTLLNLIARLQQVMSVDQGRTMLLDYARKSCGARLALLFTLDEERQVLALLTYSGRFPHPSSFSLETTLVELSLQGLFASALQSPGFLNISDISREALSLPEERVMAWPHGRVLLHALRQGQRQGVLVFCFSPAGSRVVTSPQVEEELLICTSLLAAYLSGEEEFQPVRRVSEEVVKAWQAMEPPTQSDKMEKEQGQEEIEQLRCEELIDLLTRLCELGLLTSLRLEKQELGQQILQLVGALLYTSAGCLWRYQFEQKTFLLQTFTGDSGILVERATAELNALEKTLIETGTGPISGMLNSPENDEHILVWHILSYREQVLGALGLVVQQKSALAADQLAWLDTVCEIVAFILLHYDQRISEQQTLIEEERSRIAREMHDSVVQDVAHVTQKLDYIQRILERQPQTALNELEQARQLLSRSLRDLRYGISALLPVPLEEQEFGEALKSLLHEYSLSAPHLKITWEMENLSLWPQVLQTPVYRFIQEALNNIRKHASASEVSICIRQIAGLGIVQVRDNGQGFVPEQIRSRVQNTSRNVQATPLHMGLLAMEERIRQAGGVLEVRSKPGEGTTLKARFSLSQSSAVLTEREREVLRLLVDGLTNRAISERLSVSLETVKSHVHHIMQKMHVRDRTQAAVVATRQQWL